MESLLNAVCDVKNMSVSSLAFVGDAVFEILVREYVVSQANAPSDKLHRETTKYVCCEAQSKAIDGLMEQLLPQEISIYKRGRNFHTSHIPKNSTRSDYGRATGLETLFGYLYLNKQIPRLRDLFFSSVRFINENFEKGKDIYGN